MADAFGKLALPAPPVSYDLADATKHPALYAPDDPVGDPGMAVLSAFLAAVLNADLATALGSVAPFPSARFPIGPGAVRARFHHKPEAQFEEDWIPALFVTRSRLLTLEDMTSDLLRMESIVTVQWVFTMRDNHGRHTLRSPIVNACGKSLARAIRLGRHPAWTVTSDAADPDAIRMSASTSTSTQTLTSASFNGVIGAGEVNAPRAVTVTTTAAVGAYTTASPIAVTGLLASGQSHTEYFYLTEANGGETVKGIWKFKQVTEIVIPAQALTTGTFTFGFADSPELALGSLVRRHAGFESMSLIEVQGPVDLVIPPGDANKSGAPRTYPQVLCELRVVEFLSQDLASSYDSLDDADDGQGLHVNILHTGGTVLEDFYEE
ncbi:MAG: hypothetical protein ACTHU0_01280 [Kofleriaceae bacterium]